MLYAKVYRNKGSGQKLITIPKGSLIQEGDWVQIKLIPDEVMEE